MLLSDIPVGASFKVDRVILDKEVGKRLADMGFTEEARGKIIRRAFFHGPMQVRILDYDVLIRRSEARGISVQLLKDEAAESSDPDVDSEALTEVQAGSAEPLSQGEEQPKPPQLPLQGGKATRKTTQVIKIALAGNPNSGKTTLFNALTGAHYKVGNYPGVTVEKREGNCVRGAITYHFIDLPGIYSLTAYSEDEIVARDFILGEKPDLIIDVLDSTNLERNLFLCLQIQELGIPLVGALNMSDEAQAKGIDINENKLGALIGVPFVKISAHKSEGLDHLLDRVDEFVKERERIEEASLNDVRDADNTLAHVDSSPRKLMYSDKIEEKINELSLLLAPDIGRGSGSLSKAEKRGRGGERYLAIKLLEKDRLTEEFIGTLPEQEKIKETTKQAIADIEKYCGKDSEIVISEQRYVYLRGIIKESVRCRKKQRLSLTESIDNGIMNRFLALPIFLAVLWCIFQLTFTIGAYPQSWLESLFGLASHAAENALEGSPLLQSLVVDGIIGGVGSVFSFVPLIVILFFFLSILEDLGYMSRAAFATDKLLNMFGLHGQSIFPMTLGFGCSVPAILASRTLKSRRDRILTVLVTPMMSCGAKLPIHVLFAGVFFGKNAPNIIILVYLCGIILALLSSLILKHTILRGAPTPFVLELPPYRMPTTRGVLSHVWEKFFLYFKKAGTVILASSILIWCITSFPRFNATEADTNAWTADYYKQAQRPGTDTEKNDEDSLSEYLLVREAEASLEYSAAGRIGYAIEPLFRPLGFNWKMSVATLTSFAAKEVVVSTLGIVYQIGNQEEEGSIGLREALAADTTLGTPEKAPLAAFSFMLFMLIIPPCFAALATIRSELGGKWLAFEWVYLFLLGWVVSFIVFQLGMAL